MPYLTLNAILGTNAILDANVILSVSEESPLKKMQQKNYANYDFFSDYKKELGWYNPLFCDSDFEECLIYAQSGDALYMDYLAFAYLNGVGLEVDEDKAVYWYSLAAQKDDKEALCALAAIFSNEKSPYFNSEKAFELYEKAAALGYGEGQLKAGLCCLNGVGTRQNHANAAAYFEKAANNYSREAQFELALLYEEGKGVEQSFEAAAEWLRKSAQTCYFPAMVKLAQYYLNGTHVERDEKAATVLLQKAAKYGNEQAKILLKKLSEGKL